MDDDFPPLTTLSRPKRRVLGTLIEKGLTTPGSYPLTLKAATTGCNQTSNRDPVTNFSEDAVQRELDELQEVGLTAEVHTAGGRAAKYRHLLRKRVSITEPQIAVLAELLLRGRQSLGELRARASRMVPIPNLDELREALEGLAGMGFVTADGPLTRRGATIDHALYEPGETPAAPPPPAAGESAAAPPPAVDPTDPDELAAVRAATDAVRADVDDLRDRVAKLADALDDLRRDLGVA